MVPSRGLEPPGLLQTRQVLYQLSYDGMKENLFNERLISSLDK
ncbi:MAG: hypothetical protein JWQ21_2398 [Herminiimonas sp.]|jgi:hypothetical protein|nr:hypothetical protein [Herminiimonas sp.]